MRAPAWKNARGEGARATSPPYTIQCTALVGQEAWILSMSELEAQGMRLYSSMSEGECSYMITRRNTAFELRRGTNGVERGSLFLEGSVVTPGDFVVPPTTGGQPLSLLVDTGAMTSVAGAGWETMCGNVSHKGRHARGVGGTFVRSAGSGDLTITFRTGRAGLWLTSTALRLFQSSANAPPASSIKGFYGRPHGLPHCARSLGG